MPLIVGLGNPGPDYHGTRHNIGFEIADRLASALDLDFEKSGGMYLAASGNFKSKPVVIIKPLTYMNRSGGAVTKALAEFGMELQDTLVCYDDINLPPGKLRFRDTGSAGGHNGVQDIIDRTGTREFPRLRFGIGNDFPRGRQVDYVLGRFSEDDRADVDAGLEKSEEALLTFIRAGIVKTMNHFN